MFFGTEQILFLNNENVNINPTYVIFREWIHFLNIEVWMQTQNMCKFSFWTFFDIGYVFLNRINSLFEHWSMDANIGYVFSNKEGGKKWNWQSEVDFPRGKSWFDHRLAKPVEIDDQIVAELLPINSHFILDYNYWLNTLIPSICSQYFAQILRAYNSSAPSLNRLEQTHFHDRKYILDKVFIFI